MFAGVETGDVGVFIENRTANVLASMFSGRGTNCLLSLLFMLLGFNQELIGESLELEEAGRRIIYF